MSVRVFKQDINHLAWRPPDLSDPKLGKSPYQADGTVQPWRVPTHFSASELSHQSFSVFEKPGPATVADDFPEEPQPDLGIVQAQATAILEAARAQADQLVAVARSRAAEIEATAREQALMRGREDGLREGRARMQEELAAAVAELRGKMAQSLEDLAILPQLMAEQSESDLVQLAIEIAKKIVHREVTVDREIVLSLVRVALSRINRRSVARIHLNPDEYQFVLNHREKLGTGYALELVEDPTIDPGGCVVETDFGDIDARISQQFAEIERGFFGT